MSQRIGKGQSQISKTPPHLYYCPLLTDLYHHTQYCGEYIFEQIHTTIKTNMRSIFHPDPPMVITSSVNCQDQSALSIFYVKHYISVNYITINY